MQCNIFFNLIEQGFIQISLKWWNILLISGHLQQKKLDSMAQNGEVAIPFYFRVTCNRHFFRLDWLKTYLSIPRFSGNLPGSILSFQYLKK